MVPPANKRRRFAHLQLKGSGGGPRNGASKPALEPARNPPAAALSIAAAPSPRAPSSAVFPRLTAGVRRALILIGIGLASWSVVLTLGALHGFHLHAPRLDILARASAVLQVHIAAAVGALVIGMALLIGVKGRTFHKTAGWTWVACMMTVALSSFWIRDHGRLSYIHFLSGWTSLAVPMGVAAVKRGDMKAHRAAMTRTFMGGLIIAGAFTFVPGRMMWRVFLG